jgi:cytidylate kinase
LRPADDAIILNSDLTSIEQVISQVNELIADQAARDHQAGNE